jgi:hypothetical protein
MTGEAQTIPTRRLRCLLEAPSQEDADHAHVAVARSPSPGVVGSPAKPSVSTAVRPVGPSGANSIDRPPMVRSVSGLRGVDPLQSRHVSPAARRISASGPAPARFLAPSTTSLRLAPSATTHPPSSRCRSQACLSLSAVCQHTRASRPCFMPQTVRGVLPSERCSSPRSRSSLEAACSLAVGRHST